MLLPLLIAWLLGACVHAAQVEGEAVVLSEYWSLIISFRAPVEISYHSETTNDIGGKLMSIFIVDDENYEKIQRGEIGDVVYDPIGTQINVTLAVVNTFEISGDLYYNFVILNENPTPIAVRYDIIYQDIEDSNAWLIALYVGIPILACCCLGAIINWRRNFVISMNYEKIDKEPIGTSINFPEYQSAASAKAMDRRSTL